MVSSIKTINSPIIYWRLHPLRNKHLFWSFRLELIRNRYHRNPWHIVSALIAGPSNGQYDKFTEHSRLNNSKKCDNAITIISIHHTVDCLLFARTHNCRPKHVLNIHFSSVNEQPSTLRHLSTLTILEVCSRWYCCWGPPGESESRKISGTP